LQPAAGCVLGLPRVANPHSILRKTPLLTRGCESGGLFVGELGFVLGGTSVSIWGLERKACNCVLLVSLVVGS